MVRVGRSVAQPDADAVFQRSCRLAGEGLAQIGMILGWIGLALSLVGCCIAMVAIVFPLLLGLFAVGAEGYGLLVPALLLL